MKNLMQHKVFYLTKGIPLIVIIIYLGWVTPCNDILNAKHSIHDSKVDTNPGNSEEKNIDTARKKEATSKEIIKKNESLISIGRLNSIYF